jgi:hypothetical protein
MRILLLALSIGLFTLAGHARSQVVINVPPESAPNSISGATTLNLFDGGELPYNFQVHDGSTLNIQGGYAEGRLLAQDGSRVNISGGTIGAGSDFLEGRSLLPQDGSKIHVSGGAIGDSFYAESGVAVTLEGFDFRLNGELLTGLDNPGDSADLNLDLGPDSLIREHKALSGVFADGTPFVFAGYEFDYFSNSLTLLRSQDIPPSPAEVTINTQTTLKGALPGQRVNVVPGGELPLNFGAAHGSRVDVTGGAIGENFEGDDADIFVQKGTIGPYFDAIQGSTVSISESTAIGRIEVRHGTELLFVNSLAEGIKAWYDSAVHLNGGSVGELDIRASDLDWKGATVTGNLSFDGADVYICSGSLGGGANIRSSEVSIAGGQLLERQIVVSQQSIVTLLGTNFFIDGQPIDPQQFDDYFIVNARGGSLLSGTLADGTPFDVQLFGPWLGRPSQLAMYLTTDSVLRLALAVPEPNLTLVTTIVLTLRLSRRSRFLRI